MIRENKISIWG